MGNFIRSHICDRGLPLFQSRKRGQALVEMAITLPILLLLVVGALEMGRMIYSYIVITNAAREGAYYLSYNPDNYGDFIQVVLNESKNSGIPESAITVLPPLGCCTRDFPVTVTVKACINGFPLLGWFYHGPDCGNNSISLSNSVDMMVVR